MVIGALDYTASYSVKPNAEENGVVSWKWDTVLDGGIEITYTLKKKAYIGAVVLDVGGGISKAYAYSAKRKMKEYTAETDKTAEGHIVLPVEEETKEIRVHLGTWLKDVTLSSVVIYGAYEDGKPLLFPTPVSYSRKKGSVTISDIVCANSTEDELAAKKFLEEKLDEYWPGWMDPDGVKVYLYLDDSEDYKGERYTVSVKNDGITLMAGCRLSLVYAADTLVRLGDDAAFACCTVDDKPYKEMRGFHFGLPAREQLPLAKAIFRDILIPMRYNQLFIEFAGGMPFDKHPEISEGWERGNRLAEEGKLPKFPHGGMNAGGKLLEKDEVRDMVDFARELGFELIPEVQSFGHVQYITFAHPEIAEVEEGRHIVDDTRGEDARPDESYAHCYCPSMQESYDIIHDIIDEIVEVVRPQRYVHMGHDEIYQVGVCPRCRDKKPEDLYARHVNDLHDYLQKKGLGMMIWSDMLQPTERYKTYPAADMIPKDIVMLDFIWYFHFDLDMEDNILPHGFKVVAGNLYSSHYPRYRSRIAKKGMLGGEVSTWIAFTEKKLAMIGKFWDVMYTSQMLWSENYHEDMRRVYTHVIHDNIQPVLRDDIHGIHSEMMVTGTVKAGKAKAEINGHCDRLEIRHITSERCSTVAWSPLTELGKYVVTYADGSACEIPVEYNGNIIDKETLYAEPLPQQYHRHTGYVGTWMMDCAEMTKDGMVCSFLWDNPSPEKEIASVTLETEKDIRFLSVTTKVK